MTKQLWTRTTPWTIHVSPLDDENMPHVADYASQHEAQAAVMEHNAEVWRERGIS